MPSSTRKLEAGDQFKARLGYKLEATLDSTGRKNFGVGI